MFAALPILAVITSAADLKRAVWNEPGTSETFAFTGTVTSVTGSNLSYWIMDETGVCYVRSTNAIPIAAGDRVRVSGHVGIDRYQWQRAFLDSAEVVGRNAIPEPISLSSTLSRSNRRRRPHLLPYPVTSISYIVEVSSRSPHCTL